MNATRIEEITRWWGEHLNLGKVFEDVTPIALCLDAQRRFNETHKFEPQFMRMNIPLVIRAFRESTAYKRNQFVNFDEKRDLETRQIYTFKTKWNPPPIDDGFHRLDAERDYLEQLTPEFVKEFDALFMDTMNQEIVFHGIGCLKDGTLTLMFSK